MSVDQIAAADAKIVNGLVVEASAGTGKTYWVAERVTEQLALHDDLRIGEILITTFARNAAAELRERVRDRLIKTARQLRAGAASEGDVLVPQLLAEGEHETHFRAQRLERAIVEFDTATISTIHSVCTKVLRFSGFNLSNVGVDDITSQVIDEVVNDALITDALTNRFVLDVNPKKMIEVVAKLASDPFITSWYDPTDMSDSDKLTMESFKTLLENCVKRVQLATLSHPNFDDLLQRAHAVVIDPDRGALVDTIRARFKLAFIDEAQDTDMLQWEFFKSLFPGGNSGRLIAVGDPKQAIFAFRGADVNAFIRYSNNAPKQSLATNHRSDAPIVDALNEALAGSSFGAGILYTPVEASADHLVRHVTGTAAVEFIDVGEINSQDLLAEPTARKVSELLTSAYIDRSDGRRLVAPSEICVLVRGKAVGRAIERKLKNWNIPAVSNGTESVMNGAMAGHVRSLLESMERINDVGRTRRVAGSPLYGQSLRNFHDIDETILLRVQENVNELKTILQGQGIAAVTGAITGNSVMMEFLMAGQSGERNLTDFVHVMEALHGASDGKPCSPIRAIELFVELKDLDDMSDLVSRRVESDVDAVQIMTIHSAKGLQFPCVVVADLWKPKPQKGAPTFYRDEPRVVDIGYILDSPSGDARAATKQIEEGEGRRLLYVALTRAEHHLSVLVPTSKNENLLTSTITNLPELRPISGLPAMRRYSAQSEGSGPDLFALAPSPGFIAQTFRRSSFSGLMDVHKKSIRQDGFAPVGGGNDDDYERDELDTQESDEPEAFDPVVVATQIPNLPSGRLVGTQIHKIFENIDPTLTPLEDEVRRAISHVATSALLRQSHNNLIEIITKALRTPFGGIFGDVSFADIALSDRLAEMDFDMTTALTTSGVLASDVGHLLLEVLDPSDPVRPYAKSLTDPSFDIPIGGVISGSLDALLRLPTGTREQPLLAITDYKSNKLHDSSSAHPLDSYAPDRLLAEMEREHYLLQALIYGTSVFRMLRWRLPDANQDACIKGIAYGFIRGMVGPDTPHDENGHRYGVFTWAPPAGTWARLSDLFAGKRPVSR